MLSISTVFLMWEVQDVKKDNSTLLHVVPLWYLNFNIQPTIYISLGITISYPVKSKLLCTVSVAKTDLLPHPSGWKRNIFLTFKDDKVLGLSRRPRHNSFSISKKHSPNNWKNLQAKYAIVIIDKVTNNVSFSCHIFLNDVLVEELELKTVTHLILTVIVFNWTQILKMIKLFLRKNLNWTFW